MEFKKKNCQLMKYKVKNFKEAKFILPDRKVIRTEDCFTYPAANLFNCFGKRCVEAIFRTDLDLRKTYFENIITSGGNSRLTNFTERMSNDIEEAVKESSAEMVNNIKLNSTPEYSVWIGAQILSYISTFKDLIMTREIYDEQGCYNYDCNRYF